MFNTEKAFDMLPTVVEIYDKLDLDNYRKQIARENKDNKTSAETLGINMFKYVLKNSKKIKEEVFEVVAIFEDKTVEEIKVQSPGKTINTLKNIFSDKDTQELFKSAIH